MDANTDKIKLFGQVVGMVAGIGGGMIVENVVKATLPKGSDIFTKAAVGVGAMFLSRAVGEIAENSAISFVEEIQQSSGPILSKIGNIPSGMIGSVIAKARMGDGSFTMVEGVYGTAKNW